MRLSAEEYQRGLLKFNAESDAKVETCTSDGLSDSGWYSPEKCSQGLIVGSPAGRYGRLRILPGNEGIASALPITWERLSPQGNILTSVTTEKSEYMLANIPTHGTFRRIVMEAPSSLVWEEDTVLRVGDIVIRTHSGSLMGEQLGELSIADVESSGNYSIESSMLGTEVRTGRFIEVVVNGCDHHDALTRSSSITGLLALAIGGSVLGPIVFSEPYHAEPGEPQKGFYDLPNYASSPGIIASDHLEVVDGALPIFDSEDELDRALQLALHWFEKGLRSRTPLDELTCFFIGIEAVLNVFVKKYGPVPELDARRARAQELKELLAGKLDKQTREYLLNSLQRVTTRERFDFYCQKRSLPESWKEQFKQVSDARNSAFHGSPASVSHQTVIQARTILVQIFKTELNLTTDLPWENGPQFMGIRAHFLLKDYGDHGD